MAKIRVYELAKTLNITNKMLLNKMKELNIEVGSHMSSLDQETIDTIKESIYGKKAPSHEEKRVKKTVIRRRKRSDKTQEEDESVASNEETEPENKDAEVEEEATVDLQPENAIDDKNIQAEEVEPETASEVNQEKPAIANERLKARSKSKAKIIFSPKVESEEEVPEIKPADSSDAVEPNENQMEPENDLTEASSSEEKQDAKVKQPSEVNKADADNSEEKVSEVIENKSEIKEVADEDKKESEPSTVHIKKKKTKKFTAAKIIKLPEKKVEPERTKSSAADNGGHPKRKTGGKNVEVFVPGKNAGDVERASGKKGKKAKKGAREEFVQDVVRKKSKRKTVVEGNALYSEGRGRKGRKGGKKGHKQKQSEGLKTQITTPKAIKRRVKIDETINLSELAKRMGIKANDMIVKLMGMGVMATVNQTIDFDTATLVASEFGFELEQAAFAEDTILNSQEESNPEAFTERPPVVTIMGHVDHGKTSLLDVIRKSSVTTGEAGGITQHIGAYNVKTARGQIVFLDTPGHEAFTAMRSRGASVTDIVVLVVAADDGVMPQTIEAINHAKAAEVPIIVAVNKIDKDGADPDRVKRELSDHGILSEDWGGDAMFVHVSAKQKIGIEDLLEMILLQSEMLELKADPDRFAKGHVVEAKLDSGRGPIATILIQEGTLKSGQSVVCGIHYGKIRAMFNDKGDAVKSAGPSIPVEIIGLTGVPDAGDELIAVSDEKSAKQVSSHRMQKARAKELAQSSRMSLESLFEQIEEGEVKDLNLIIKADVHGSIEALKESLGKLSTSEVKINVVHSATGTVTESDVSLASVSNAIILGFNVRPETKVRNMAKEENVDMRFYDIIYDAIKDLKDAMVGMMESTFEEKILGIADVLDTFYIPKKGTVAGCLVKEGKIVRGERVRLLRDGVIIFDGNIASLKRFKDDAKEVMHGYECGIGIENYNDIKIGDKIDCYMFEEIKPSL